MPAFLERRLSWAAGLLTLAALLSPRTAAAQYSAPEVLASPHHSGFRDVTLGSANVGYTTPAYVSRDESHAVTFLYSSGQMKPMRFVQVEARDNSGTLPTKMSIRVRSLSLAWMTFPNGSQELFFQVGSGWNRLAAQFDDAPQEPRAHSYDVVVTSYWADGTVREAPPVRVRVPIINERDSPFGRGWSLVGLQRLHDQGDGVFITGGDGSGSWFPGSQSGGYTSPEGDFTSVVHNGVGWTRTYPDGTEAIFGWSGYLDDVFDRFGNQTHYSYDTSVVPHRIASITDPAGKQITFGYTGAPGVGALAWVKDANRTVTTTTSGYYLYRFIDPDGVISLDMHFAPDVLERYWTRGQDRSVVGNAGAWNFGYDTHGRLASLAAPQVYTTDAGDTQPVTLFKSLEAAVLPAAGTATNTSPAARVIPENVRVETTNPRGYVTKAAVDRFGHPTRIEEPLGRVTQITRDVHGRPTVSISPSGHTARNVYSGMYLTKTVDETLADTVEYEYGAYAQLRRVWGPQTPETLLFLNSMGLPDSTRVGGTGKPATKYSYSSSHGGGRLAKVTDPEGHFTSFTFGDYGNTVSTSIGTGSQTANTTSYTYDTLGRRLTTTVQSIVRDSTWYNALNQVEKTKNSATGTTSYYYTSAGALFQVTDPRGVVYKFNHNALGWLVNDNGPGGWRYYSYDRNGNQTRFTNRRSQTISAAYDGLNRIQSRSTPEGQTTTWGYGINSESDRWMQVANSVSTDRINFDVAGRDTVVVTTRGSSSYTQSMRYTRSGQRDSLAVSGPSIGPWTTRWRYNALQQLDTIVDRAGRRTRLVHDKDGFLLERHLPNSNVLKSARAASHRPANAWRGTAVDTLSVTYEESGPWVWERSRWTRYGTISVQNFRRYSYDPLGQLQSYEDRDETRDCSTGDCIYSTQNLGGEGFTYDASGNRTPGGVQAETNRLTSSGGYTMTYDNDGNLTRKYKSGFDQYFVWNSLGQLVQTTTNGAVVNYRYDGLGRWVQYEQGTSGSIDYIHDGDHLLLERSPSGEITEYTYYPGTDRPHSIRRNSTVHYYMTDEPGDVVALLAEDATIANRYSYGPHGTRSSARETIGNALQFQARHFDPASDLYYFRARWYDRDVGRFISEDPIGLAGGINPYVFAANNPVNLRDPSGLMASEPCDEHNPTPECILELAGVTITVHVPLTPDQICVAYGYCGYEPGPQSNYCVGCTNTVVLAGAGGQAGRVKQAAGAAQDFLHNYFDMREANVIGADLYFHAKANCQAAQRGPTGVAAATRISDAREWFDKRWPKQDPPAATAADQQANRMGRMYGMVNPTFACSNMLSFLRPNGLPRQY